MARTSYFAPGVYVEEVPSAQQPIAGVGTNTVGFIGVVPDEIEFPIVNEKYDPEAAKEALEEASETNKAEIQKREREEETLNQELKKHGADLQKNQQELEKEGIPANQKKALQDERKKIEDAIAAADEKLKDAQEDLKRLKTPPKADQSKLRPYLLETFTVEPEPCDTKLCTNFGDYKRRFGPFSADDPKYAGHRALTHAVYGFFKNGGTKCFVARVRSDNAAEIEKALAAFESIDAIAIVAAPGMHGKPIWQQLVSHCATCEDRFAILDGPEVVGTETELDIKQLQYDGTDNALPGPNKNAAFYLPYIHVIDPAKQLQDEDPARGVPTKYRGRVYVAPSGHMAGIYARTDEERGVHKAPANATVLGAIDVKYYIGKPSQELLNPQGVNCIRSMNGNITVWGARTIGGDKNGEWKYVSVRRLFLFLAESIDEGTQWVVFEPNDQALWGKIRRNVGAFLTNVWRSGALFGATPQEAFYVKCDEETNPPEVRELGQVITEIGVAIVRPAEFVIFRITQSAGREA
jgi:phage tail sheath protein FI